jgi:Zn-dependent protease with chaperone function
VVFALYDQQVNIMKQKVEKLIKKAEFKKVPTLIISKDEHLLAKASILRKKITVGTKLLSQWQKGEIDENDVEVTLAHEIGHLMDFERKFHSVFFRYNAIVALYLVLGVVLPKLVWYPHLVEPWIPPLLIFIVWAIFLHWIVRRAALAVQLEADKNGARLVTDEQFANSIIKRSRFHVTKDFGLIETWEYLLHVILFPSISERLQNLNFEIKEIKIQKIEDGRVLRKEKLEHHIRRKT